MGEKEEYVELTIRVPKRLMDMLEQENYFGWSKEDFFVVAVKRGISCEVNDMDIDELSKFREKYGEDLDMVSFDLVKRVRG